MPSDAEYQIRQVVLAHIRELHRSDPSTVIVEEFGVRHGSGRADLAVFNGRLEAYEIKSDRDTLARLDRQIRIFSSVFDTLTIVCGGRHTERLSALAPAWCGISSVQDRTFIIVRAPQPNPRQEAHHLIKLLHKHEVEAALTTKRVRVRAESRQRMYARLIGMVDIDELRAIVLSSIKQRAGVPQTQCGD